MNYFNVTITYRATKPISFNLMSRYYKKTSRTCITDNDTIQAEARIN